MSKIIRRGIAAATALSALIGLAAVGAVRSADAQVSNEGALIVNEFNAVGPTKYLEGSSSDTTLGRIQGNGGDWIELVATRDISSIVGWTIDWANDDPDTGTVTFKDHADFYNIKSGTIILLRPGNTSATAIACGSGDWLMEVGTDDTARIEQSGHSFKTDNDGWRAAIFDDSSSMVQDYVGEEAGGEIWNGSGVNSEEVAKLEANPSANATIDGHAGANYQDGNCSSYGAPNCWNNGSNVQSFAAIRTCP